MAKNTKFKRTEKEIKKEGGFGSYREDTGGGEPIEKGGKWKPHKKEKRVTNQPRTNDGKFTYNAVNGKPLKEISKGSDGKSRGTTIPPTLTGGKNGVEFKGQKYAKNKETFDELKKHYEKYDGEFYRKGDKVAFQGHIKIAKEDMIESLQEYVGKHFKDYESGEWETKKGRHSKSEAQALKVAAKAPKKKGEVFVVDLIKGDIENYFDKKKGKKPVEQEPTAPTNVDAPLPSPEMPIAPEKEKEEPVAAPTASIEAPTSSAEEPKAESTAKYTPEQLDIIREEVKAQEGDNYDESYWTDEKLSDLIDSYGGAEIFEEDEEEAPEEVGGKEALQSLADKPVWDNNDLQKTIEYLNNNPEELEKFEAKISDYSGYADAQAIKNVINGGYFEEFDSYDSDVAEQYINIFKDIILGKGETDEEEKAKASELLNTKLS